MDLLREFVRLTLQEAAFGIKDLQKDYFVRIIRRGNAVKVELLRQSATAPIGGVMMNGPQDGCAGAYVIAGTAAEKGWGPFLYDIAIEWASMYGEGLVPDRGLVSPEARHVWNYYMTKRGDVKKNQLDTPENQLTPTDDDNCDQESSIEDVGDDFTKSPLSKRYTKEPTTINALKKIGRLRIEG